MLAGDKSRYWDSNESFWFGYCVSPLYAQIATLKPWHMLVCMLMGAYGVSGPYIST